MGLFDFRFSTDELTPALNKLPTRAQAAIRKVIKSTTKRAIDIAIFKTPVDSGRAIRGWKQTSEEFGLRGVFSNDVPYINVLEFGGYPVTALGTSGVLRTSAIIRGKAQLGGHAPGPRTQKPPGGLPVMLPNVSKQAPRGMVRSTLIDIEPQFVFDLNKELDTALNAP